MANFDPIAVKGVRPLYDHVIVEDMVFEARRTRAGLIIPNDNGKAEGIRPRWAKVYSVGPEQKDVAPGQWILVEHGRWTRGVKIEDDAGERTIRRVDTNDILLVSDEQPSDETMSDAVSVTQRER